MLIDLQDHVAPLIQPMKSIVCIAGAGIAGLVLATALSDSGVDVHLLEGGGRKNEERSQCIYDAEMADEKHTGTTEGRFRIFGGTSTRWGGQILPFTDDIFIPAAAGPSTGWPLHSDALKPFYRRIEDILGINRLPFDADVLTHLGASVPSALARSQSLDLRFSKWAPFSRRNLAQTLGEKAVASSRITVFLHANLTECLLSPDHSGIEAFLVRNYRGTSFRFKAQQYVLATGTIETSRLLLASRSVCVNGVGNLHDQVGRNFHDHISAPVAVLKGTARKKLVSWLGPFVSRGTTHTGRLEARIDLRRKLNLPAIMAHFTIEEPDNSGMFVARELLRSIQRGDTYNVMLNQYRHLAAASLNIARLGYHARVRNRRAISPQAAVTLRIDCEQHINLQNRIRLAKHTTDSLGTPKAVVDWRVSDEEIESMRRYTRFLRDELNRLGAGAIDFDSNALHNDGGFPEIRDTNHPMGGTVMGLDPRRSVVDPEMRVHGVSNLYVASCSTFPSGGSSNPTFTMMALTLRLSEWLTQLVSVPITLTTKVEPLIANTSEELGVAYPS